VRSSGAPSPISYSTAGVIRRRQIASAFPDHAISAGQDARLYGRQDACRYAEHVRNTGLVFMMSLRDKAPAEFPKGIMANVASTFQVVPFMFARK